MADKKYGCTRAPLAEIRWLGSYCSSCCEGRRKRKGVGPWCGQSRERSYIPG